MRIRLLSAATAMIAIAHGNITAESRGIDWELKLDGSAPKRPHCVNSGVRSAQRAAQKRRNMRARSKK